MAEEVGMVDHEAVHIEVEEGDHTPPGQSNAIVVMCPHVNCDLHGFFTTQPPLSYFVADS